MLKKARRPQANGADKNPPATVPAFVPGALKLKPAAQYLGGLSVPTMHRLIARGLLRPNRAWFRSGKIRILDSSGNLERTIPFNEADRKI